MIPLTPEELAAVKVLAGYAARCGCYCHVTHDCPHAEYVGESLCAPILCERMLKYAEF